MESQMRGSSSGGAVRSSVIEICSYSLFAVVTDVVLRDSGFQALLQWTWTGLARCVPRLDSLSRWTVPLHRPISC